MKTAAWRGHACVGTSVVFMDKPHFLVWVSSKHVTLSTATFQSIPGQDWGHIWGGDQQFGQEEAEDAQNIILLKMVNAMQKIQVLLETTDSMVTSGSLKI